MSILAGSRSGASLRAWSAALAIVMALPLASCAYYNTYYLARKHYRLATEGLPYPVEKPLPASAQHFNKTIEYSKKVIAQYPRDKWVDDAYLLWGRALIGIDDPLQTVKLLEEFSIRYPDSPLKDEATFYLGVAYRSARKYRDALRALDEFLERQPRHKLAPYALLERSRALRSLDQPEAAAAAAGELIERFPKSALRDRAFVSRAEARYEMRAFDLARQDFRELGARARSDAERLEFLMREADALEGARHYDEELKLLDEAISHEQAPAAADTAAGRAIQLQQNPTLQNYGRLMLRIGTVHLLAERFDEAVAAYAQVAQEYRRTEIGAEAQYRLGYAYETIADDFERARAEYARVKEHGGSSTYVQQANQRLTHLEQLAQFRSAGGDSIEKKSEAGFLLAELYLFQLDKPDRALDEYRKIAEDFAGTPIAAKALNAQAWVLSRKLERPDEADSLLWQVVRQHPATEAQLAARDYLELNGVEVPAELIKMPERPVVPADTLPEITPPPSQPLPLFQIQPNPTRLAPGDSLSRVPSQLPGMRRGGTAPTTGPRDSIPPDPMTPADTSRAGGAPDPGMPPGIIPPSGSPRDSLPLNPVAPADTSRSGGAPADTSRSGGAPADTSRSGRAPADTSRAGGAPADTNRAGAAPADSAKTP